MGDDDGRFRPETGEGGRKPPSLPVVCPATSPRAPGGDLNWTGDRHRNLMAAKFKKKPVFRHKA